MITQVYEYSGCSTCKKAIAFLKKRGTAFESIPIVERPPTLAQLKRMLDWLAPKKADPSVRAAALKKLFNTSGQLYREMKLGQKLAQMTEAQALKLLSEHGKLVKRPFVLGPDFGLLGFQEAEWRKRF